MVSAQPTRSVPIAVRTRAFAIGRSLPLHRMRASVEVKTPFQTVLTDFPYTAYR